ncbi:MAG: linear amide C-N hydrolase [Anaerolineae bacterium]|nr:linear amide C-N hydrolase [Anaerolineae bacterium]
MSIKHAKLIRNLLLSAILMIGGLGSSACAPKTASPASSPAERTLLSLEKVDDHPLYVMHYEGAYISEDENAGRDASLDASLPSWACSLFAALGDAGAMVYGRNFDWEHSPAVLLFTAPPDGYASVSLVDIAYLGFTAAEARDLTKLSLDKRRPLLDAPYLPFDGMNEYGLAIGMAAIPDSPMPHDPAKKTIGSLGIIREMLDHARTVDEAITVMGDYNVDMGGGPAIHYLIADATGKAALVEFYEGEMVAIPNDTAWHQSTNFLLSAVTTGSPKNHCWRYDKIAERLWQADGRFSMPDALALLSDVSQSSTQWSVVYGMSTGEISIAMGRNYDTVHTFRLRHMKIEAE